MMRVGSSLLVAMLALTASPAIVLAQDPGTRADALRREREEKSKQLEPAEPARAERLLMDLESGRLFERLLNPAEGVYPKIGNITAGSGFSLGPAYRRPALFGGHADFSTFGIASFKKYWMLEARLVAPRLAAGRLQLDVHAQRYDFPEEPFFGIGPDALRTNETTYGIRSSTVGGSVAYRPIKWFSLSGGADHLTPRISAFDRAGSISSLFDGVTAPGLTAQPDFIRYDASADVNYREPRGNPRGGGQYKLLFQRFHDLEDGRYSFDRLEVDAQQYISLLRQRRILALHALVSVSGADDSAQVPFYFQRALGGPDDLRGFRRNRFRDRHALLLQAEYRWEIFTAVDGAIFYDAGKVASRVEDLNLRDLEHDYGIGFRFGTRNGVFLRVETAFGSSAGTHFIFRFGNVF